MIKIKEKIDSFWCALIWLFPIIRLMAISTVRTKELLNNDKE